MWIICAGSKRSGSTLQYNLISRIIEESKLGIRIPFHTQENHKLLKEKYSTLEGVKVLKTHTITNEILDLIKSESFFIFHSYRDVRDVVVSYINKGWSDKNNDAISKIANEYIEDYYKIVNTNIKNLHSRKYEEFAFNLNKEIKYISKTLNIELEDSTIDTICKELDLNTIKQQQQNIDTKHKQTAYNQSFNKKTLVHSNHINSGKSEQFVNCLSKTEIVLIEKNSWLWLLNHNYSLFWPKTDYFLSFSQHADDYIAWQIIGKKNTGYVIEVGAFDGIHLSNSYSLAQKGWKSINIEPTPEVFKILDKNRPNSKNINCAIVGDNSIKTIDFYSEEIGVLSGCTYDEDDIKKRYENRGLEYKEPKKIKVTAKTLNQILSDQDINKKNIDVISIDVEGFELEVLKGLDLSYLDIGLFIIEANDFEQQEIILKYFADYSNYIFLGSNHQNLFVAHKNVVNRKALKKLNFSNLIQVKQCHTVKPELTIDSVKPNFKKSKECLKFERSRFFPKF